MIFFDIIQIKNLRLKKNVKNIPLGRATKINSMPQFESSKEKNVGKCKNVALQTSVLKNAF